MTGSGAMHELTDFFDRKCMRYQAVRVKNTPVCLDRVILQAIGVRHDFAPSFLEHTSPVCTLFARDEDFIRAS